ncbi:MAG: Minf_1886 family protein [Phycisphaeraceae bacterium]
MSETQVITLREAASRTHYPLDAFHFVRRGLDYTVHRAHSQPEKLTEQERHVSGDQLSLGLRDFAIDQYGHMARTVLRRWRINRTEDFGRIVFAMVDAGLMQATESDSVRDFDGVFDLDDAMLATIPLDRVPTAGFEPDAVQQT